MSLFCGICKEDLANKDLEFHYGKFHPHSKPSREELTMSLRESNKLLQDCKKVLDTFKPAKLSHGGFYAYNDGNIFDTDAESALDRLFKSDFLKKRG